MTEDRSIEEMIAATPAPKVLPSDITNAIARVDYTHMIGTVTVCAITLRNGYIVIGTSACASPENFSKVIGEALSYKDAANKIWALEAYLLREELYAESCEDYKPTYAQRVMEWSHSQASVPTPSEE